MITGSIRIDLTDVEPRKMRGRCAVLATAPSGARVVLVVGPLTVEPEAVRVLRTYADTLMIDVQGEPYAVPKWIDALRHGTGELIA